MALGIQKAWSVTAADNDDADSNIGLIEGGGAYKAPHVNNTQRAIMAATKAWANQITGAKTSGGSADAQTLTSDAAGAISSSYAAGMRFTFKAGYTNTGACTLNVDGVGAVAIRKGAAYAALAAGDITAGGIYDVVYESSTPCFVLLNVTGQPLDATLTALAALSWSSGNALIQMTAADTVSLTLTPSVTSVTASGAGLPARFVNSTDAVSNQGIRIESDRATPANNDLVYASFLLSDSAGNQDEFGRITVLAPDVASGSEDGWMLFGVALNGTLTNKLFLSTTQFSPNSDDGIPLGASGTGFSDLFLASGGVINFSAGNYTLTHSSGAIEASGTFRARAALSSETSGTLTAASANKRVKATAGVTINDGVFAAEDAIEIYNDSDSSITLTQDTGMTLRLAGTTSTGNRTLAARTIAYVYFDTNADAAVAGSGAS